MLEIKRENASALRENLYETIKNAPGVADVVWINADSCGFSRQLGFRIGYKFYHISWAWNESYLYFEDDSMFRFNRVEVSGTWPNRFKTNLQFYLDNQIVAIIPIEEY